MLSDSLERLVPDDLSEGETTGQETLALHMERYAFAARHVLEGRILDAACGVGYGTRLLADHASGVCEALGVDLSEQAVRYARQRYGDERTSFECGDLAELTSRERFDSVVSLETIEHLNDPRAFLAQMVTVLKPGGVLVASVPTTPSVDINPHHLHDFTPSSFRKMVQGSGAFRELECLEQVQPVNVLRLLKREETRLESMRRGLCGYYVRHPDALLRRVLSTLRHGFANRYLTVAWRLAE